MTAKSNRPGKSARLMATVVISLLCLGLLPGATIVLAQTNPPPKKEKKATSKKQYKDNPTQPTSKKQHKDNPTQQHKDNPTQIPIGTPIAQPAKN